MDYTPPPPYVFEYSEDSIAAGLDLNESFTILVQYSGENPITKRIGDIIPLPPQDDTRYEVIIRVKF